MPALDAALAKETDERIKRALAEARAAVMLHSDDASEADRLDAIATIRARSGQDAVAALSGLPSSVPDTVTAAARDAIAGMQSQLVVWEAVQNAWYGISLGSVLLLAAIGLAITFGVMGVINMAHGEMVMLGAYVTFVVQELIRQHNPALFDYSLFMAVPLAFLCTGLCRHSDRAGHHPVSLRPAAGDLARDLGPVAGSATSGAHRVRPDQQGGRQPVVDERRVRGRLHHHHLQPALDRLLHARGVRRAARTAALHATRPSRCGR